MNDLKIIKKRYGEKMMHLCRELFPSLLETPGLLSSVMLEHFEPNRQLYDDIVSFGQIESFKNYIYSFVDVEKGNVIITLKSPDELLSDAGYDLYECKTEEDIQSFRKYYASGEELCTFRGNRLDSCYVFFAVKKNVGEIKRENFTEPRREDEYGTSVISIQFRKTPPNTLSIKNRYNHTVNNPDNTFYNNLDNIIPGLNESFAKKYNYDFTAGNGKFELPGYVFVDGKVYKYKHEFNNIYYCHNNIIIDNFRVIDKYSKEPERYIVLNYFIVDLKEKRIELYDKTLNDGFVDEFKNIENMRIYKDKDTGNRTLEIIYDGNKSATIVIDTNDQIIGYNNYYLIEMGEGYLGNVSSLTTINVPNLVKMNKLSLLNASKLEKFDAPNLIEMDNSCLSEAWSLKNINVPKLNRMGHNCLRGVNVLTDFSAPNLIEMGDKCFEFAINLVSFNTPNLISVGNNFMDCVEKLSVFVAPKLSIVGEKHFMQTESNFMQYLMNKVTNLTTYVDAINQYMVPKQEDLGKEELNKNSIKRIGTTIKTLTDKLNTVIYNNIYRIKEFKKIIVKTIGGSYRR